MPIPRPRTGLPGVKSIPTSGPGYEYVYLHGAVEPETGQWFFTEQERLWRDPKDRAAFDFYRSLACLGQEVRTALAPYTDEAAAPLTGSKYLLDAASALSS